MVKLKKESVILGISSIFILIGIFVATNFYRCSAQSDNKGENQSDISTKKDFIKYVEFNPTYEALEQAMNADINSQNDEIKINWIDILSCLATKYGGDFKKYKNLDTTEIIEKIKAGKNLIEISGNNKLYNYYKEAYGAVLGEFLGKYKIKKGGNDWETKYGLKVFSPIAKTFPFSHYEDFGASRTYGYSRPHLGHDLMAATGTPVIAVESGTVEIMGWNRYGGWRIGIRSFDKKRYYYYAHLRQNRPYHCDLKEGNVVKAGDVIGYVGRTGYSSKENVNNIQQSHLHLGVELIFDESQKESNNEIWINLYSLTKLLEKNRSEVMRNPETKEYYRVNDFSESNLDKNLA